MSMEVAKVEVFRMETNDFGSVRPAACIGPPKRPTQTVGHARPSNVLHFASDQQGIGSYRRSLEVAKEEKLTLEKSISGNVRPIVHNRPPKRPT